MRICKVLTFETFMKINSVRLLACSMDCPIASIAYNNRMPTNMNSFVLAAKMCLS